MTSEHRRPLVAFIGVTLLCALVVGNGMLFAARSALGGDLASARGIFSGLEGAQQPELLPEVVDGTSLPGETVTEPPAGTFTEARVPALDAIRDTAGAATDQSGDATGNGGTPRGDTDGGGTAGGTAGGDRKVAGGEVSGRTGGSGSGGDDTRAGGGTTTPRSGSGDGQEPGSGTTDPEPGQGVGQPTAPGRSGQAPGQTAKTHAPQADKPAKADKPEKAPTPDEPAKPAKPEKPAKADKPDKAPTPDKPATRLPTRRSGRTSLRSVSTASSSLT